MKRVTENTFIAVFEGGNSALQCQRAGWKAIHFNPNPSEEWAVASELAAEAQLHATQQFHAEKRWEQREPAQEQLGSRLVQSPVLHPVWWSPDPERHHLTWGLPSAGCPAPPAGAEDCGCIFFPDGTGSFSVPRLNSTCVSTCLLLLLCFYSLAVHWTFLCTDTISQCRFKKQIIESTHTLAKMSSQSYQVKQHFILWIPIFAHKSIRFWSVRCFNSTSGLIGGKPTYQTCCFNSLFNYWCCFLFHFH